jgi:antitoxin (DNA-binding transcriptional repressor) of toxin-antitoxin stability system
MLTANIFEVKTKLSRYLKRLKFGEVLVICNRNQPVAELKLIGSKSQLKKRRIGTLRGEVKMSADFNSLPDDMMSAFNGER